MDSYGIYAASALAAQTVSRSVLGFAFPLFSVDMYRNLGIHWATTILAFAAMLLAPVPFLFYKCVEMQSCWDVADRTLLRFRYGERIRMRSKYAMANA